MNRGPARNPNPVPHNGNGIGNLSRMVNSVSRRRLLLVVIILFLLSFSVYNANFRTIGSGDTIPTSLIPIALITKGSLVMDEFYQHYLSTIGDVYYFQKTSYGYISSYPIATGLLITPFYVLPVLLFEAGNPTTADWASFANSAEKIAASGIAALSVVVFLFVALRLSKSPRTALVMTVAYAFGSQAWVTSSQGLWMHGPGAFFILLSCLVALYHEDKPSVSRALWISVLVSMTVLIRPTNVVFAAPMFLWLCIRKPRYIWAYTIPALILGALLASYNLFLFEGISGRYAVAHGFNTPLLEGLAGVLFSPSRGLFLYFPVGLFALCGTLRIMKSDSKDRSFFIVLIAFSISQIIVISLFSCWWGGWCYGSRYMTEIQPALLLLAIPFLEAPKYKIPKWSVFLILLAWSVFVQAVGAFLYPIGEWDAKPSRNDPQYNQFWDFRDNPVSRGLTVFLLWNRIMKPEPLSDIGAQYRVDIKRIELSPGEVTEIEVSVTNTGKTVWYHTPFNRHARVYLSYNIRDVDGKTVVWNRDHAFLPHETSAT